MNTTTNTIKQVVILLMLPVAVSAQAACVTDAPEIGDTGPSSEVVCDQLEGRFAGAVLVVEGRSIHSPTEVSVHTSVDGTPVHMCYKLTGYTWHLNTAENSTANAPIPRAGLSMHEQRRCSTGIDSIWSGQAENPVCIPVAANWRANREQTASPGSLLGIPSGTDRTVIHRSVGLGRRSRHLSVCGQGH